jgi:glucosamine-6-phosphate deaminase
MEVILQPDAETAALLVARIIAHELRRKPNLVLGLATGRTMEAVYAHLARLYREEGLSFAACRTFNLDEYIGLPAGHPGSYRYYMNEHFFSQVDIDLGNTHLPDGMAADLRAECARYENKILECGGIDLQLVGIGRAGHIGFNEPMSALRSRTRDKTLTHATLEQNAALFGGDPEQVPHRAITMGVGTILESKRCLLLATGYEKAGIISKALEGPITSRVTASALQLHPNCTAVLDYAAAATLEEKEYYHWVFESEPEWQNFCEHPAGEEQARPVGRPEKHCRPLPNLEASNLREVQRAFQSAESCTLRQTWLPTHEGDFAPATVRTGWRDDSLLVLAELTDRDIFSQATGLNQRCWELGDSFEIFLRDETRDGYLELQVTPNNQRLQLRYAGREALERARATGDFGDALISGDAFRSKVWIEPDRWVVLAEIPSALVCGAPVPLAGRQWRFSFSRYDYTRGRVEPVISSTSPHPQADFHRLQDWGFLRFERK